MSRPDTSIDGALAERKESLIQQIHSRLWEVTQRMIRNQVLDVIEKGAVTQEQWREFAQQRYLAARHFESLLKAGLQKAQEAGDQELVKALSSNLRDEEGIAEDGSPLPISSHEK